MTDEMRDVWLDLVIQAKKNITKDDPTRGDEAIVQAHEALMSFDRELARVGHKFQILETRLHKLLTGSVNVMFTKEDLE